MMISATATASHLPWRVPLQHRFCDDRLHRHTPCDHPAAWFGRIPVILHKIAPFLPCEFCYTVAIMTGRGAVGNLVSVSWFLLWSNPHQPIKILIWWEIYPGSLLGPSDGLRWFVRIICCPGNTINHNLFMWVLDLLTQRTAQRPTQFVDCCIMLIGHYE